MPNINKYDFGLLNAYAIQNRHPGNEIAVIMASSDPQENALTIEGIGMHPAGLPPVSTHTAIVNALQHQAGLGNGVDNKRVFSTYRPTAACIGMMKTHRLHSVTCMNGANKEFRNIRGTPNVNNIVAVAIPQANMNLPQAHMPPPALLQNPNNPAGCDNYLAARAAVQPSPVRLAAWAATWNALPVPAGPRRIAALQTYMTGGGALQQQDMIDAVYMLFIFAVAGRVRWPDGGRGPGARVAAVLGDNQGRIYGWQVNQRQLNTTFHAETNLVQSLGYTIGGIPNGCTLYTTLEPCHQCAGLYVRAGGNRCVFAQNDPNMTNNTALAGQAQLFNTPTYLEDAALAPITVGARLDEIRHHSTVAAQAAAVARARLQNPALTIAGAIGAANIGNIQVRVLDILNTTPTLEVFHRADRVLGELVGIYRQHFAAGNPRRVFIENFAQALGY